MKNLRDYTLGQAQDICKNRKGACKVGEDKCDFYREHGDTLCGLKSKNGPYDWDIAERKYFSNDQLAVMREFYRIGYRYFAKCKCGLVYFFKTKPIRQDNFWATQLGGREVPGELFQQIAWSDEPIFISDYIKSECLHERNDKMGATSLCAATSLNSSLPSKNMAQAEESSKEPNKCAAIKELKRLADLGLKYIARNKYLGLIAYYDEPIKTGWLWEPKYSSSPKNTECEFVCDLGINEFKGILWEDDSPRRIDDLMEEFSK